MDERYTAGGCGVGSIIAVILSWITNHSILYALLHGILSWFYIVYWVIKYYLQWI
jgi:hypothetical protein